MPLNKLIDQFNAAADRGDAVLAAAGAAWWRKCRACRPIRPTSPSSPWNAAWSSPRRLPQCAPRRRRRWRLRRFSPRPPTLPGWFASTGWCGPCTRSISAQRHHAGGLPLPADPPAPPARGALPPRPGFEGRPQALQAWPRRHLSESTPPELAGDPLQTMRRPGCPPAARLPSCPRLQGQLTWRGWTICWPCARSGSNSIFPAWRRQPDPIPWSRASLPVRRWSLNTSPRPNSSSRPPVRRRPCPGYADPALLPRPASEPPTVGAGLHFRPLLTWSRP